MAPRHESEARLSQRAVLLQRRPLDAWTLRRGGDAASAGTAPDGGSGDAGGQALVPRDVDGDAAGPGPRAGHLVPLHGAVTVDDRDVGPRQGAGGAERPQHVQGRLRAQPLAILREGATFSLLGRYLRQQLLALLAALKEAILRAAPPADNSRILSTPPPMHRVREERLATLGYSLRAERLVAPQASSRVRVRVRE